MQADDTRPRTPASPPQRPRRHDPPSPNPEPPPRVPDPEPGIPVPHPGSPGPEPHAMPELDPMRRLDEAGEESFPASDPPAVSPPDPPPLPGRVVEVR